jgi:hypothetical protein
MLKYPFCFYDKAVELPTRIFLFGVRFRYQFHPRMNTNITYPNVLFDLRTKMLIVANEFQCPMDIMVMPRDPNAH